MGVFCRVYSSLKRVKGERERRDFVPTQKGKIHDSSYSIDIKKFGLLDVFPAPRSAPAQVLGPNSSEFFGDLHITKERRVSFVENSCSSSTLARE